MCIRTSDLRHLGGKKNIPGGLDGLMKDVLVSAEVMARTTKS